MRRHTTGGCARFLFFVTLVSMASLAACGVPASPAPTPSPPHLPPTSSTPTPAATETQMPPVTIVPSATMTPAPTPFGGGTGILLFSSYRDGESDLYLLDVAAALDGTGEDAIQRLTDDAERVNQPTWSPDGRLVAYTRRRDGKYREIWALRVADVLTGAGTHKPVRLVSHFRALDSEPAWSPDGRQIAFASSQDSDVDPGDEAGVRLDVYLTSLDGSGQVRLTGDNAPDPQAVDAEWNTSPAWSPDGGQIAFQTNRDGNNEIYVMAANGFVVRNLTRHPASDASPAWSPNGTTIAFVSDRDGNEEIYLVGVDGSGLRRLTHHPGPDKSPAWSPDGHWLAFHADRYTRTGSNFDLHLVAADGSDVIRLTTHADFDGFADWQSAIPSDFTVALPTESLPADVGQTVASEVAAWLAEHAIPLDMIEPARTHEEAGAATADLAFLAEVIGDARIVDLGGSNFGSHEALAVRHRIVQYLVEVLGFDTLIFDVSRQDAALIDAYIHTGTGDPVAILAGLDDPRWNNEEVHYLIEWLRLHNQDPGDAPQVRFASIEPADPAVPMDRVVASLIALDPKKPGDTSTQRQPFYDYLSVRHSGAFENVQTLAEEAGPAARYIVWTHNFRALGTVLDDGYLGSLTRRPLAAWLLGRYYGEEPYAIGFAYGAGAFTAYDSLEEGGSLQVYPLSAPPPNSFEWTVQRAGLAATLLPLEGIARDDPGTAWLHEPILFRQVIAVYDPTRPAAHFYPVRLPRAFDAIVYVHRVSPVQLREVP
jgi:Tol biopolymer transport system component/erythromycin esterase-like protein